MTFWKGMTFTPRWCDAATACSCSASESGSSLFCLTFIWLYRYLMCIFPSAEQDNNNVVVCDKSLRPHWLLFYTPAHWNKCRLHSPGKPSTLMWCCRHAGRGRGQPCGRRLKRRHIGTDSRGGCIKYYNKLVIHFLFKDWCPLCPCWPVIKSLVPSPVSDLHAASLLAPSVSLQRNELVDISR